MRSHAHNHPDFKQAQTTIEFLLGPVKIKDGLFMGDQLAARDIEFIVTNKVTHVINTVSKAVPNLYERFGVQYLSVHWAEKEENIFDRKNNAINAIFTFIEEAMEQGESCLIHSLHGKSRACAVLVAYLMKKYSWSLNKSLELVNAKKEGLEIRSNYLAQMQQLENRMLESSKLSYTWSEVKNQEDELLSNTFSNSKKASKIEHSTAKKQSHRRITWDERATQKFTVTTNNMAMTMNRVGLKQRETPKIKSILKGFPNVEQPTSKGDNKQGINNMVPVTVNNFMQTEKKPEPVQQNYNTRPYSSDTKQREKKINQYEMKPNKLFSYDTALTANIKTAYESKIVSKIGSNIGKNTKKVEQPKKVFLGSERPQSANIVADRKKVKNLGEQLLITGSMAKKRYPSTNPREQMMRLK